MYRRRLLLSAVAMVAMASGQDFSREPGGVGIPLIVDVPEPPVAVRADGKYRLVYEMHLTSWTSKPIILKSVEVWSSAKLATLEGEELTKALIPSDPKSGPPTIITDGLRVVVLFWITVDEAPASIHHRVQISLGNSPETLTLDCASLLVGHDPVPLQPPLHGERWLALNGPSNNTHHRRGLMVLGGRLRVPQRFAIDFLRLNEEGNTHEGDPKNNRNYLCYGAQAFAVGKARVAAVKDGVPENIPDDSARAVPMTLDTADGNYVVLDLGGGHYALYAHLQPGSLRVKPGDRVHPGQILGLVGNSGNSTEPHLHFQVSDSASPLESEGLPYTFNLFYRDGIIHRNEIPLEKWEVRFP